MCMASMQCDVSSGVGGQKFQANCTALSFELAAFKFGQKQTSFLDLAVGILALELLSSFR